MSLQSILRRLAAALKRLDQWDRDWEILRRLDEEMDAYLDEVRQHEQEREGREAVVKLFRRRPIRLTRVLGKFNETEASIQAQAPVPAGSLIYTPSGSVAHVKSALHPGALCEDMREWTGWLGTGSSEEREWAASLPSCHHCETAEQRVAP